MLPFFQILNWMDNTEKTLASDDLNLPNLQDITPRLLKYKVIFCVININKILFGAIKFLLP